VKDGPADNASPLSRLFVGVGADLTSQQGGNHTRIPPPRTQQQRNRDALKRLEHDTDAWVATAQEGSGIPYLVPLSSFGTAPSCW
jgi:hypothetical protein